MNEIKRDDMTTEETQNTAEEQPLRKPEFGHQLKIVPCQFEGGQWVKIVPNGIQRFQEFVHTFLKGIGLAVLVLSVIYLPDFIFDYSQRGESFVEFFGKFFSLAVLFVAVATVIAVRIRDMSLFIEPDKKRILCARSLSDKTVDLSVELSELETVTLEAPSGFFKRSRVMTKVRGADVILVESYGTHFEDMEALRDWLSSLCAK